MADDKVKAEVEKIEVSTLLSIDSPMIIWHTDLEALGLGGGTSGSGTGTDAGGVSGGGAGSRGGEPGPPPRTVPSEFVATCDAVAHEPGDGVFEGRWFGVVSTSYAEARASADQHPDGLAYVALSTNGVLVGPVTSP